MNNKSENVSYKLGSMGSGMLSAIISMVLLVFMYNAAEAVPGLSFWVFFFIIWMAVYMFIADRGNKK